MNFSKGLCPKIGTEIPLEGSYSSEIFQYGVVNVIPCDPSKNNATYKCTGAGLNRTKPYVLDIYSLKTIINPLEDEFMKYVLSDRNYMSFYPS